MKTSTTPARDEFTSMNELIVHVDQDATPDGFNRVQFFAYWPTDQEWVLNGVRAQIFFADLDAFVERAKERGDNVRLIRTENPWCEHGVLPADACDTCSRTVDGTVISEQTEREAV